MYPPVKRKVYAYLLCRTGPPAGRSCKRSRIDSSTAAGAGAAVARAATRAVTKVERRIVTELNGGEMGLGCMLVSLSVKA